MAQNNMQNMLKQAQKMQAKMFQVQDELKQEVLESSAGGGMVKVAITGDLQVQSVTLNPDALDPDDIEMVQDMIVAAVNEAIRSAQELANRRMSEVTGNLNIPGLM
ncbi:MAG: YbaB/EbfC family nucleoid-associated protein [Coriobacteriia bacterium]